MITISLDEQGNFEKEDRKALFIAGLIFDDREEDANGLQKEDQKTAGKVKSEKELERERIRAYYKRVVADAGDDLQYPQDLHVNKGNKNSSSVASVKRQVSKTLAEFFSEGTYNHMPLKNDAGREIEKRKGRYHLFVILKSDDGKKKLLDVNTNMFAKDSWAANRYFHMASCVVNRIIFHNPLYSKNTMPTVSIDIASRATGAIGQMEKVEKVEFEQQAYKESGNLGYQYYSVTNADIYRTLIAQEMVNSKRIDTKIKELFVRSIQYDEKKDHMEFLYLSDSICSVLGYKLAGDSAQGWLKQIDDRINGLNCHNENLVFGYDEIDNDFAEAWNCYERKFYYEALSIAYDANVKKGAFAGYYREKCFPYLEECIRSAITPEYFNRSVNDLSEMLTINNLDQEKLLYLMQQFEKMIPAVANRYKSIDMRNATLYKLYDAGVSAFCHVGNAKKALEYYDKCKNYAFYVGVDAFLSTNNKLLVCLEDSFEWDKALELAKNNVKNQEVASAMKREILQADDTTESLHEAKAISQLARILAEKRDPQAESVFKKALGKLERGSANYKITQSYLLHFYADMGMKEQFEEEATDYFDGNNTYSRRLKYVRGLKENMHAAFSNEYALYVLIRGLFLFGQDAVDDAMWDILCSRKGKLTKCFQKEPSGHPWEITYKYLEMMAIKRHDEEARKAFADLKRDSLSKRGEMIVAIELFGDAEVAEFERDSDKRDACTSELANYLKENFETLRKREFSTDGAKRYQELEQYFTFMYR